MRISIAIATLCWVGLHAVPAYADTDGKPWAEGVPQDQQDRANQLYAAANAHLLAKEYAAAIEKYTAAVALWNHPSILYNMAAALIELDRILEADEALRAALRYDALPFTPELYQQARTFQRLVGARIGELEVSCDQPGVEVALDGARWFSCPGTERRRVLAGEHTVLGERADYMTKTLRVVVTGNATAREPLTLVAIESLVKFEYPVPRWVPWLVAGSGAVVAVSGLGVWLSGREELDRFERDYTELCPTGCSGDISEYPFLAEAEDRALFRGKLGIALMAIGGTALVGGSVWAIMNRPRRLLPTVEVAPSATSFSAQLGWRF